MKKVFKTMFVLMCGLVMATAFVACGSDDDDKDSVKTFTYEITTDYNFSYEEQLEPGAPEINTYEEMREAVLTHYRKALGVTTNMFSLNGTQVECDKKVYDACKIAEDAAKKAMPEGLIYLTIIVANRTTKKNIYSYTLTQ